MDTVNLLLVAILLLLTAFFVATEFAIVRVRSSRINQLIAEGNKNAVYAKKLVDHPEDYFPACQLGITAVALGLGWLGGPAIGSLLQPVFGWLNLNDTIAGFLSFLIAFLLVTFLHVVIGELAPKTIATQKAEAITLMLSRPIITFHKIMYPFIWLLNSSAKLLVRLLGYQPEKVHDTAHSEEEVRMILTDSYKNGEINLAEMTYVNNIFEFDETIVREIMVPRNDMVCFYKEDNSAKNINTIQETQYTRYPLADGDKDNIIGLVNLKDIVTSQLTGKPSTSMKNIVRPIIHVSETTPIRKLLLKMQKERIHMAVVHDEYGGTAGIITVEDILEEIVGEIRDEFDADESPDIEEINENTKVVAGQLQLVDLNKMLGTKLPNEDADTIGGWVFSKNMEATVGSTIVHGSYQFIIDEMDKHQVKRIKIVNS